MKPISEVDEDEARKAIGSSLARIEMDCSITWPNCPRGQLICDCRLRATRAVNAIKLLQQRRVDEQSDKAGEGRPGPASS